MNDNMSLNNLSAPPRLPCPAVSVIIPLYNTEKYVAECLDSILAQTFQNYEIIVVDDCSTDSSPAIVESYLEKFGGRLKISRLEKNSGSGGLPRNKGIEISRGEYIQFLDADDIIIPTALEEIYSLAKSYDADVVYCERYFMTTGVGEEFVKNLHLADSRIQNPPFVDKPTFETKNLAERVEKILRGRFWWTPWSKFVRHDLIMAHKIFFPHCKPSEDDIWCYGLIFYASKFLRVPNVVYVRRMSEDSVMSDKRNPQQIMNFWVNPVLLGLKSLDKFMGRLEFFQQNPQYRYAILEKFTFGKFSLCFQASLQLQPFVVYETIKQEFGQKLGDYDVLISALCTAFNTQQKISLINQQQLNQFAAQAQVCIAELEKLERVNKAYISELENFIMESQQRIADLENELKRKS